MLFGSCKGFLFNVSRGAQGVSRDLFSNVDPSGTCPRTNAGGRSWCLTKNAECSQEGCCMCACSYKYSTFRMDSSMNSATCVENSAFRNFAGKKLRWWFRNFRLLYNNNIPFTLPLPELARITARKKFNYLFHSVKIDWKTFTSTVGLFIYNSPKVNYV